MKPIKNMVVDVHGIPFSVGERIISLLRGTTAILREIKKCSLGPTCSECMSEAYEIVVDETGQSPGERKCYGRHGEKFWTKID